MEGLVQVLHGILTNVKACKSFFTNIYCKYSNVHLRFPGPILSLLPPLHTPNGPLSLTQESLIPTFKTACKVTSRRRVVAWAISTKNLNVLTKDLFIIKELRIEQALVKFWD